MKQKQRFATLPTVLAILGVLAALAMLVLYRHHHPVENSRLDGVTGCLMICSPSCIGLLVWAIGWNRRRRLISVAILLPASIATTWPAIYLVRHPDVDVIDALLICVLMIAGLGFAMVTDPKRSTRSRR